MDNPNGINAFPNGLSTFPNGIATGLTGFPPAIGNLINEDLGARHYYDNMDDAHKAELLRNAKDFQSQEELERYLYHIENDEFR
ncbi:hypothetical protein Ana3638_20670 [Anaerocolumna sedimenticola]|uniref:Uncharacterized protein n=1 Tax=Anaerocolumna sedimenticola TaxID=2696063 RepID=A0A6P1TPI0_9FIRM|nr:hypothetical protein [Anaerocolumna sedimenticola]QHQ62894.1 hypothetical protein Ana3638_20670 [Anaerocolumna sedimenticola]